MNLLTLYYFVELARELHVTNTAQKLYISQQNLSQHIQRLEQYYGVSLFHRKPKLALTYEGEQLYAVAVKILAARKHWSMVFLSFMEGWGRRKGRPGKALRSVPRSERFFRTLQVSG